MATRRVFPRCVTSFLSRLWPAADSIRKSRPTGARRPSLNFYQARLEALEQRRLLSMGGTGFALAFGDAAYEDNACTLRAPWVRLISGSPYDRPNLQGN